FASDAFAETARPTLVQGDVALSYRRAPNASSCPDEAAFRERAADGFDFHDPFVPPGADAKARMRIEITRTDQGFLGTLFAVGPAGNSAAASTEQHVNCDALVWVLSHRVMVALLRRP